jgi:hypothetical protein
MQRGSPLQSASVRSRSSRLTRYRSVWGTRLTNDRSQRQTSSGEGVGLPLTSVTAGLGSVSLSRRVAGAFVIRS